MTDIQRKNCIGALEKTAGVMAIVFVFAIALVFFVPLAASFFPQLAGVKQTVSLFAKQLSSGERFLHSLKITLFTLKIALGSTLVAFCVGFPAAFFTARRSFWGRKFLLGLSTVPLSIPVLIAALGYVSIFGLSGFFNSLSTNIFGSELKIYKILYSQWGIMIAQGFYNFPLVMSIVGNAWQNLPEDEEYAARILGANPVKLFFSVTLPKLIPSLASSIIPVFLFCFFSFMMVLLFSAPGTSTLEVEIYQAVKNTLDLKTASSLAVLETTTAFAIVILYSVVTGSRFKQEGEMQNYNKEQPSLCNGSFETTGTKIIEAVCFGILILLIFIFFILPLLGIVFSGFTFRVNGELVPGINQYKTLFLSSKFWKSLGTTICISTLTGLLCTVFSFTLASLVRLYSFNKFFHLVSLLPMAVSSIVMGWGITLVFGRSSWIVLVLVQTALFWPLGYRQIQAQLDTLETSVVNASKILSNGNMDVALRIFLPYCSRSLFSCFAFCFAFSAGDTSFPLILSIPDFSTLSLYTYRLAGSYRFQTSCASGTILAIICYTVFSLSQIRSVR